MPTVTVYEEAETYRQYSGACIHPVAVFERERSVIEAAKRIGESIGATQMRVVFIVEVEHEE